MRGSYTVREGEVILLWIPALAATSPAPPLPQILHEDDRLAVLDKPPGMMCHPSGDRYVYALIGLAKERWPELAIDLVHRIDAYTSGIVLLTKDAEANRAIKGHLHDPGTVKRYEALVRGRPDWSRRDLRGPIGPADGIVRIQMAVRDDGLPSLTEASVLGTKDSPIGPIARVACRIRTGRTHQIRVHLAHAGHPILGDRLYSGRAELFLDIREKGLQPAYVAEAGAPRHTLHATHLRVPHPDGGWLEVTSPLPLDMARWWAQPERLPHDTAG